MRELELTFACSRAPMIEIQPAPGNMIRTDGRTLKAETRLRFPMVLVASHVRPCSRGAKASS
jgi:hypothetical protein